MRPKFVLPLAGLLLLACIGFYAPSDGKVSPTSATSEEGLAVYFSPKGGCTDAVVNALGKARQMVPVQVGSVDVRWSWGHTGPENACRMQDA